MFHSQKFMIILLCIAGAIGFIIVGANIYVEKSILSRLNPDQRKEFDRWRTEKLQIKLEELEAPPFRETTIEAAKAFARKWEEHSKIASEISCIYNDYNTKDPDQRNYGDFLILVSELEQIEPLFQAFENLVTQPDYEMDVLIICNDFIETGNHRIAIGKWASLPIPKIENHESYPVPNLEDLNYFPIMATGTLLRLKTESLLSREKFPEAFQTVETIIRSSRTHKYSSLMCQLVSFELLFKGIKSGYQALELCEDFRILHDALEWQTALLPPVLMEKDQDSLVINSLGIIRRAKRLGWESHIENMTAQEIMGESLRLQAEYLEQYVLPFAKTNIDKERIQKAIENIRYNHKFFSGQILNHRFVDQWYAYAITSIFYVINLPNKPEVLSREMVSLGKYDLLRLETASKLYRLEKGGEPQSLNDLVPEYLSSLPKDVFSLEEKGYGIKPRLYSVGPDGIDQECEVRYDPTNGTVSGGDVFLISQK